MPPGVFVQILRTFSWGKWVSLDRGLPHLAALMLCDLGLAT